MENKRQQYNKTKLDRYTKKVNNSLGSLEKNKQKNFEKKSAPYVVLSGGLEGLK